MHTRSTKTILRVARTLICITTLGLPTLAPAGGTTVTQDRAIAPSGFNWLGNGATASTQQALANNRALRYAYVMAFGDGSWICSPAGSGKGSYCYRN